MKYYKRVFSLLASILAILTLFGCQPELDSPSHECKTATTGSFEVLSIDSLVSTYPTGFNSNIPLDLGTYINAALYAPNTTIQEVRLWYPDGSLATDSFEIEVVQDSDYIIVKVGDVHYEEFETENEIRSIPMSNYCVEFVDETGDYYMSSFNLETTEGFEAGEGVRLVHYQDFERTDMSTAFVSSFALPVSSSIYMNDQIWVTLESVDPRTDEIEFILYDSNGNFVDSLLIDDPSLIPTTSSQNFNLRSEYFDNFDQVSLLRITTWDKGYSDAQELHYYSQMGAWPRVVSY